MATGAHRRISLNADNTEFVYPASGSNSNRTIGGDKSDSCGIKNFNTSRKAIVISKLIDTKSVESSYSGANTLRFEISYLETIFATTVEGLTSLYDFKLS